MYKIKRRSRTSVAVCSCTQFRRPEANMLTCAVSRRGVLSCRCLRATRAGQLPKNLPRLIFLCSSDIYKGARSCTGVAPLAEGCRATHKRGVRFSCGLTMTKRISCLLFLGRGQVMSLELRALRRCLSAFLAPRTTYKIFSTRKRAWYNHVILMLCTQAYCKTSPTHKEKSARALGKGKPKIHRENVPANLTHNDN